MAEVVENQRWYPFVGWTARLHTEDPPAWCNAQKDACPSKDEQKEFVWQVYKGQDYDEEGWLYGENFQGTLGPMTRSSVVRTRVWMGNKLEVQEETADAAEIPVSEEDEEPLRKSASKSKCHTLVSSNDELHEKDKNEGATKTEEASVIEQREDDKTGEDIVLDASMEENKTNESSEISSSWNFFGRISSAALSLPSSAINLAGSSSKQAVYGTVQSIKEASLCGLEMAQAATAAAISSEPVILPQAKQKRSDDTDVLNEESNVEVLSMLSKRFPDLSPFHRSLVTCCKDGIVNFVSPPELTESKVLQGMQYRVRYDQVPLPMWILL
uniref:Uncharacterized protein n=1 Tax=Peronospora matthiolae TaxID=2874970 RepID=A0AAV1V740_9STRA